MTNEKLTKMSLVAIFAMFLFSFYFVNASEEKDCSLVKCPNAYYNAELAQCVCGAFSGNLTIPPTIAPTVISAGQFDSGLQSDKINATSNEPPTIAPMVVGAGQFDSEDLNKK